jgi:hypothetical protein
MTSKGELEAAMGDVSNSAMTGRPVIAATLVAASPIFWTMERRSDGWGFGWHYGIFAILIGWYLRMLLRSNPAATLSSFYQLWAGLGMLLSAAVIASGAEMIEIREIGTANGVFWLMLAFFVIGIEATFLGFRYGRVVRLPLPALKLPTWLDQTFMLALVLPAMVISIYVFALTGGPILRGIDRLTFWRSVAPAGTSLLPSLINQTFFFVAVLYIWKARISGSMLLPRLLLSGYVIVGLLVLGEKLSLFIIFLSIWLMVLIGIRPKFRFRGRHFLVFCGVLGLLLVVVAVSYIANGQEAAFVLVRGALQAQLLWSVAETSLNGQLPPLRPECYFGCNWFVNGADYISYTYLPTGLYDYYSERSNTLSGFMPALPILTFGIPVTLLLHVTVGFISGVLQRKITTALNRNQPIYGFLLFKLHFAFTLIWFAAQQAAIPGALVVIAAILLYRMASGTQKGRSHNSSWGA